MADLSGFDANNVEPTTDFDPIPAGKYLAVIVESEMKENKAGTGEYLELTFEVIEGDFTGRKLWARLNLDNPNAKAVQIAKAELSAVCRAARSISRSVATLKTFHQSPQRKFRGDEISRRRAALCGAWLSCLPLRAQRQSAADEARLLRCDD